MVEIRPGPNANLGCGTLILIAIIVATFSSRNKESVARLEQEIRNLQEKIDGLGKGIEKLLPPAELRAGVECHLDVAERSGPAPGDFGGEFTLKNTSAEPVRIVYHTDPTVGLDLDVKDEKGKTLPKCLEAYGYIYSPVHPGRDVLTIKPGETYRTHIRLFNQVDTEKHPVTPGKYTVAATFKWWTPSGTAASVWKTPSGTAASVKSNKVTIEVTAK